MCRRTQSEFSVSETCKVEDIRRISHENKHLLVLSKYPYCTKRLQHAGNTPAVNTLMDISTESVKIKF
jgi:hypothetical protein